MLRSRVNRLGHIWAAATTILRVRAAGVAASAPSCGTTGSGAGISLTSYPLVDKWRQSSDSWILRFSLPSDRKYLGVDPTLPTCISVHHNGTSGGGGADEHAGVLKKSYSPISHPATTGSFDLLVKSYPPQPGGGVGSAICNLRIGDSLIGKLKAERLVHGSPVIHNRWDRVGLVGGGTGVAPLIQLARILLENPDDHSKVHLLSINRREEDILMKGALDKLERDHPHRFSVSYSLTGQNVRGDWDGFTGRGSVDMARRSLPPPSAVDGQSTMIFVCGTDGFRDMWAGPIARAPPKSDGTKGPKIQGPLLGLLKDAGYEASDVFKY